MSKADTPISLGAVWRKEPFRFRREKQVEEVLLDFPNLSHSLQFSFNLVDSHFVLLSAATVSSRNE